MGVQVLTSYQQQQLLRLMGNVVYGVFYLSKLISDLWCSLEEFFSVTLEQCFYKWIPVCYLVHVHYDAQCDAN